VPFFVLLSTLPGLAPFLVLALTASLPPFFPALEAFAAFLPGFSVDAVVGAASSSVATGAAATCCFSAWWRAFNSASSFESPEPLRPTTTPSATAIGSSAKNPTAAARLPPPDPFACPLVSGRRDFLLIAAK
jgi:hypothetical protein